MNGPSLGHWNIMIMELDHDLLIIYLFRWSFAFIAQARVQWHNLCSPKPRPPRFKLFSCLSLPSSWDYKCVSLCPANFCSFSRDGVLSSQTPDSGDPPASASQSAGITGVSHCTRPHLTSFEYFSFLFLCASFLVILQYNFQIQ